MYRNIKKAIAEYEKNTCEKFNNEIEKKTVGELLASWYYRENMTNKTLETLNGLNADELPPVAILEKIKTKHARKEAKRSAARLEKLAAAENACAVNSFDVSVEFNRSRVWGWCPRATVRAWASVSEGYASGCGYDKESAAIASAMNDNPEIMRILYDHAESGEPFPYSVHTFAGVPSFDGGCGVSCFREVFAACGFEFRQVASGRTFNAYTATRKAARND